jgi:YVTN family beta-propeller protein
MHIDTLLSRLTAGRRLAVAALALALGVSISLAAPPALVKNSPVGKGIYELAFNTQTNEIYVASTATVERGGEGPKIFVLDAKTLAVKKKFDVAGAPAFGLGINNKTQKLYTTNSRTGGVSVIDVKSGTVIGDIQDPLNPKAHSFRILVDEDSNTLYVSIPGKESHVWIIDGNTDKLTHVLKDVGGTATGLALDKAANKLYVSIGQTDEIAVIDLNNHSVSEKFASGSKGPRHLHFDPQSKLLFVSHLAGGNVTVLNTAKEFELVKTITTGAGSLGVGFDPVSKNLVVANRMAGTVSVINTTNFEVLGNLKTGTHPNTVVVDTQNGLAYVTNKAKSNRNGPPIEDPEGDTVSIVSVR